MAPCAEFLALRTGEFPWELNPPLLTLPPGLRAKVLARDPETGRTDMMVQFPARYREPEHTHDSYHSICVLAGTMCVAGKTLKRGDYVFGWDKPHGPYEYPDGCTVFVSFHGRSTAHQWEGGPGGPGGPGGRAGAPPVAGRAGGHSPPGARKEFVALYTREVPWVQEHPLLRLAPGVRAKLLGADPAAGRVDVLLKISPGFHEARHTHDYYHSVCVLEGRIEVGGMALGPDDYNFGWKEPHGPFVFPEGATLFATYHGREVPRMWESRRELAGG